MASPGELVQIVAEVLGFAEGTVVQYDRNLLAAGLRTKGGRGRSAARVSSNDAANLLIAVAGAPISGASVKETKATYDRFASLRAGAQKNFPKSLKARFPTIGRLPPGHSLAESITAVIDSAIAGEFEDWTSVNVSLSSPKFFASVHVNQKMVLYYPEKEAFEPSEELEPELPDLRQTRAFGERTIWAIARMLRP